MQVSILQSLTRPADARRVPAPDSHASPGRRLSALTSSLKRVPAVSTHRAMTAVKGLLLGGGGLLVLFTTWWDAASQTRDTSVVRMLDVACILLALVLQPMWPRLRPWLHNAVIAFATVAVALAITASGGGSTAIAYAVVFLLPVAYAFFTQAPLVGAGHLLLAMALGSAALTDSPGVGFGEQTIVWGTLAMVSIIVGWLVRAADEVEVDALTGLTNRRGADRVLTTLIADGPERAPVVVLVDIDHFKAYNDAESRDGGDRLLVDLARSFSPLLPPGATFARYGGDDFLVVLPGATRDEASATAEALQAAVPGDATCSIGMATWEPGESRSTLLARADVALYAAKRAGRGRVQHHHGAGAGAREVRDGLVRAEFQVHFQPIVDLARRQVCGAEALVRWDHPERGLLPPGEFLPEAEHDGTIVAMGFWVLHESCRRAATWPLVDGQPLSLSVNASGRELQDPLYADHVRIALRASGLEPSRLTIELVESEYDIESLYVANNLHRLAAMGVRTAIDDFGTGYSSMDRLRRLGVDALKIDQSFVADITSADARVPLVEAVLGIANALGLDVIAEGVETPEQESWLREHGCQMGQGYRFGRAVSDFPPTALPWEQHVVAPG